MRFLDEPKITYEYLTSGNILKTPGEIRKTLQERSRSLREMAKEAFKDHQIKSEAPDRWTIAKKDKTGHWCGFYLTEIVSLRVGLFVGGDIDSVIFASSGRGSPLGLVYWVASSQIEGYLVSKASQGFGASGERNPAETIDGEIAVAEMQDNLYECFQTLCEESAQDAIEYFEAGEFDEDAEPQTAHFNSETGRIECANAQLLEKIIWTINARLETDKEIEIWISAIEEVRRGEPFELVRNELYNDLSDANVGDVGEIIGNIGVVPDARLYYAQAACKKLEEMLEAREKEETV